MEIANRVAGTFENLLFDFRNGTDTRNIEALNARDVASSNLHDAVSYVPTRGTDFRTVLSSLRFPPDSVFLDVGSGKGKVLMLASAYNFRKVIGVEFSERLCDISTRNIEIFCKAHPGAVKPIIVHSDIVDYDLRNENIFFLYNPFHTRVMAAFLGKVDHSLIANPREAWIIYHQPFTPCRSIIEDAGFDEVQVIRLGSKAVFRIYHRGIAFSGTTAPSFRPLHS